MNYISLDQVITDFMLYIAVKRGETLTLGSFPQIARVRWTWIADTWDRALSPSLVKLVQGDDYLKDLHSALSKDVIVYQLGAKSYNPFDDANKSHKYKSLLDLIPLANLRLNPDEQAFVQEEIARVEDLSIADFEAMAAYLRKECGLAAQRLTLGDEDGQAVLGIGSVDAERGYTQNDLEQISAVMDLADQVDGVIFGLRETADKTPDLIAAAALNTDPGSVQFRTDYQSAIAVPFERSLEFMAQKYLGSPSRWMELTAINYLQAPYVDLYGTKEYLISGGAGTSVRVSDTLKYILPVGTRLFVGSARYSEELRYVERAFDNGDGSITLDLSGQADLAKLTVAQMAFIRWFKPGTVNDRSLVLVPVTVAAPFKRQPVPDSDALKRLDQSLLAFGVDVKRDEATGDFIIGASGDFQLSYGVPAVRQAVLYALKTAQGELPWHQRYGVPAVIGDRWSGTLDEGNVFAEAIRSALERDPRYEAVLLKDLRLTGNSIAMDFLVKLPQSNQLIPLSFVG